MLASLAGGLLSLLKSMACALAASLIQHAEQLAEARRAAAGQ